MRCLYTPEMDMMCNVLDEHYHHFLSSINSLLPLRMRARHSRELANYPSTWVVHEEGSVKLQPKRYLDIRHQYQHQHLLINPGDPWLLGLAPSCHL